MKLFLTSSAEHLQRSLKRRGFHVGRYEASAFADGERRYRLSEDVKGKSIAIVGSILPNPESFFEIMALHCLALENRAKRTALSFYPRYARQDRPSRPGEEASASW
jgi:phosphoribosylpyrophosphate synthetase